MKTTLSPRIMLVAGGMLSAAVLSSHAFGQTETPAASSGKKVSSSLEEVLVTARRRRESLQETPIAVTALSAAELHERGIINIGELTKSIPSVEITESVSNLIYIRGIGQRSAFARVDPTVGVYLDNIFLPRADGHLLDTVDLAQHFTGGLDDRLAGRGNMSQVLAAAGEDFDT